MTICIGALCKNEAAGDTVVLASDRMVTWMEDTEFEHQVPKAYPIGQTALVLAAGAILEADRIVRAARSALAGEPVVVPIETMANVVARCYAVARTEAVVAEYFAPRQLSIESYYEMQQRLMPEVAQLLDKALAAYHLGVNLIVAGIDSAGGHLHSVENPGGYPVCHDAMGMVAIGSGSIHAMQSMIGFGHTSTESVTDTVFRVFASKRRAELAPGVGHDTDLSIITASGARHLAAGTLAELDSINAEFAAIRESDLAHRIAKLDLAFATDTAG